MAVTRVAPQSAGDDDGDGAADVEAERKQEPQPEAPERAFSLSHLMSNAVMREEVWHEFESGKNWFSNLRIAHDGGFDEVHVLFTKDRFLWALFTLSFLVMNLYVLFYPNIEALATQPFLAEISVRRGYVINSVLQVCFGKGVNPKILIALLELALLAVLLIRAVVFARHAFSKDPAHRWHAVATGLWRVVPHLTTFSSMRLLNYVAPSVLIPSLSNEIISARRRKWDRYGLPLAQFVLLRVIFAVVGFEAFMVKFLDTAEDVMSNQHSGWSAIILSIAFLNQMLGIVQVAPLVQERLFVYIFGGEDSFVSDREKAVQRVWCARLAKRIWEESRAKHKPATLWFLAVMLAYSDIDFQRLTLNQRSRTKDIMATSSGAGEPNPDTFSVNSA